MGEKHAPQTREIYSLGDVNKLSETSNSMKL